MDVHKGQGSEMLKGLEDEQLTQSTGEREFDELLQGFRMRLEELNRIRHFELSGIGGVNDGDMGQW